MKCYEIDDLNPLTKIYKGIYYEKDNTSPYIRLGKTEPVIKRVSISEDVKIKDRLENINLLDSSEKKIFDKPAYTIKWKISSNYRPIEKPFNVVITEGKVVLIDKSISIFPDHHEIDLLFCIFYDGLIRVIRDTIGHHKTLQLISNDLGFLHCKSNNIADPNSPIKKINILEETKCL